MDILLLCGAIQAILVFLLGLRVSLQRQVYRVSHGYDAEKHPNVG